MKSVMVIAGFAVACCCSVWSSQWFTGVEGGRAQCGRWLDGRVPLRGYAIGLAHVRRNIAAMPCTPLRAAAFGPATGPPGREHGPSRLTGPGEGYAGRDRRIRCDRRRTIWNLTNVCTTVQRHADGYHNRYGVGVGSPDRESPAPANRRSALPVFTFHLPYDTVA